MAVIGRGGAGKSALASELSSRTGIPVVHLDPIFWDAGWRPVPYDEPRSRLERELEGDEWIVDGNFLDAGDSRFRRVDTVAWLDPPRLLCVWRVLRRRVRDRGRARPDLPAGAHESFDWEFLRWIWRYDETDRAGVLELLNGIEQEHDVWHLRTTDGAVERILGDG